MIRCSNGALKALAVTTALCAGLLAAPAANADQTITSPGPLTAVGINSDLSCSVNHVGDTAGEFYGNTACGTFLDVGGPVSGGGTVYGANNLPAASGVASTPFTQTSQTPVSGTGSSGSPFTVSTQVDAGSTGLSLNQTDSYVTGADTYTTSVTISNSGSSPQTVVLYHAADCYLGNSDVGYGYQDTASGGIFCAQNASNSPPARVEGFIPVNGGSDYYESFYGSVWSAVGTGAPLPNTSDSSTYQDNGMGIDWTVTVPAGGNVTRAWSTDFSPVGTISASSYVALGDSVAAGEGINYNSQWANNSWSLGTPNPTWDTNWGQSNPACHQSTSGYPHILSGLMSASLLDLACTSASTSNGILGPQPGYSGPQLGGGLGAPNSAYDNASPDIVSLTVGADDVNFLNTVLSCYTPVFMGQLHACGNPSDVSTFQTELGDFQVGLTSVLSQIQSRGVADGKIPIVAITEYYSPFPNSYPTNSGCVDINPARRIGVTLTNSEMQYLQSGLANLNGVIDDIAVQYPNVVIVPAPVSFSQHRWCSADPWVYGPSLAAPSIGHWLGSGNPAPFHPTPEGQAAIAQNIAYFLQAQRHVSIGSSVPASFGGITVLWSGVQTAGTAFFSALGSALPAGFARSGAPMGSVRASAHPAAAAAAASLPAPNSFSPVQFYAAGTSAQTTGGVTVTLPPLGASALYEDINGAWQLIPTTVDGAGNLVANFTTLAPLALGNPAPAVTGAFIVSGDNGQAPDNVSFDASGSTVASGSIVSYAWDFGDGNTGSGPTASNVYAASGTYTVHLTLTSDLGATDIVTHTVTVLHSPPVAVASYPSTATAGVAVGGFDASGSSASGGPVAEVDWDFGDGSTPVSGATATHTFAQAGTYTVTTTVWDNESAVAIRSAQVVVTAPVTPAIIPPIIVPPGTPAIVPPVIVPPGKQTTAPGPQLRVSSKLVLDLRQRLDVKLTCVAHRQSCRGTITVITASGRKQKTVAKLNYSLLSGRTVTYTLALPRKLTTALRKKSQKLGVRVMLRSGKTVTLSGKPNVLKPPHKKKK